MSSVNYNINGSKYEHQTAFKQLIESEKQFIRDCEERLVAVQIHNALPSFGDNVRVIQMTSNGSITSSKNMLFEDKEYEEEHIKMSKKLGKKNLRCMIYLHNCDYSNAEKAFEKLKNFQMEMLEYVEDHHRKGETTLTTEITDCGRTVKSHREEGAIMALGNALMKRREFFELCFKCLKNNPRLNH